MTGETDVEAILATLIVSRRPGTFVVCTVEEPPTPIGEDIHALVVEDEGVTLVVEPETARRRGWGHESEFAWLTLDVHSSLLAVGLTAAVAEMLRAHEIPCNVLAGHLHDHLLVPTERADDAIDALTSRADPAG